MELTILSSEALADICRMLSLFTKMIFCPHNFTERSPRTVNVSSDINFRRDQKFNSQFPLIYP